MNTAKLTLSIPPKLLTAAKVYSRKTRQPLSRLVSRYFEAISHNFSSEFVSPRVLKVTGLAQSDKEDKALLIEALREKHRL